MVTLLNQALIGIGRSFGEYILRRAYLALLFLLCNMHNINHVLQLFITPFSLLIFMGVINWIRWFGFHNFIIGIFVTHSEFNILITSYFFVAGYAVVVLRAIFEHDG